MPDDQLLHQIHFRTTCNCKPILLSTLEVILLLVLEPDLSSGDLPIFTSEQDDIYFRIGASPSVLSSFYSQYIVDIFCGKKRNIKTFFGGILTRKLTTNLKT